MRPHFLSLTPRLALVPVEPTPTTAERVREDLRRANLDAVAMLGVQLAAPVAPIAIAPQTPRT